MLPFGHVSAAYLISQIPDKNHQELKWPEIILVIFGGIIFDFDFFVPYLFGYPGGTHHFFATHTPLAGIVYWLIIWIIFRRKFRPKVFILVALALLSHLVLDDLSYWMGLIGLESRSWPQIFWLFPFDPRRTYWIKYFLNNYQNYPYTNMEVLESYFIKLPKLFYLEIILVFWALVVFIKKYIYRKRFNN